MTSLSTSSFVSITRQPDNAGSERWFLFRGDKLLVRTSETDDSARVPEYSPGALGLSTVRTQYLGYIYGEHERIDCFSGEIDAGAALPDGYEALGLRTLFGRLDETIFWIAGRAVQTVAWDRDHQFCGRCATPMIALDHERAKECPACKLRSYPRISPAIIIAITRTCADGERILLARSHRFPPDRYSILAGFVEPGESLEECCRREVREEVGIEIDAIRYVSSQPWPFPNSLMLGFTARYASGDIVLEEEEIADARWFPVDNLPKLPPRISIARRLIDAFVEEQGGAVIEEW